MPLLIQHPQGINYYASLPPTDSSVQFSSLPRPVESSAPVTRANESELTESWYTVGYCAHFVGVYNCATVPGRHLSLSVSGDELGFTLLDSRKMWSCANLTLIW